MEFLKTASRSSRCRAQNPGTVRWLLIRPKSPGALRECRSDGVGSAMSGARSIMTAWASRL
jgi:hypothetical protein